MTSSSPAVATTSESHSAPEERVLVDRSTAGSSNMRLATIGAEAAAGDLGDDVEAGVAGADGAEGAVDQGDDGVEVGAGDGAEHPDQPDERAGGGGRVLQQLQADVVGRQAAGHDPRADDGDDQEAGAEGLGDEATGQVELQPAGTRLDLSAELAHDATGTRLVIRRRSSRTLASNAAAVPVGTGSGIDQCSQLNGMSSSSWARSQTVMTKAGGAVTSSSERGAVPDRSRPARRAAATAPRVHPARGMGAGGGRWAPP